MARGRDKAPHQAATRGGGFTGLPHTVQDSEAYRTLDVFSRAVLAGIIRRFNGRNNGQIFVSFDELCHDLNTTNRRAIGRSFVQLLDRGLIEVTAAPDRRHHKAREYRLTWISTTAGGRHVQATEEYRNWTPTRVQNHGDDVLPCGGFHGDDASPRGPFHGDDVSLKIRKYRAKSTNPFSGHGDDVSLHVNNHVGAAKQLPDNPLPRMAATPTNLVATLHQCERCGGSITFDKPARGQPKRFCSERCRKAAEVLRARERRAAANHNHDSSDGNVVMLKRGIAR
jgi:predicted nucleic acid-binding Zn ribbon protein